MAITINGNSSALIAAKMLEKANTGLSESIERMATGRQLNSAADDASGMIIADSLKSQSLAAGQEIRNASDNVSITQTADGAMGGITDVLQNIRTQALNAASGANSPNSLSAIQSDIQGSLDTIDDIAGNTSYNGQNLLDGTYNTNTLSIGSLATSNLGSPENGFLRDIDISTPEGAQQAIEIVDSAIEQVAQNRSTVGAAQNQYTSDISNMPTAQINMMASEYEIRDADIAEESMIYSQMKLLEGVATYTLNQSNSSNEALVNLLG
ncbi:flagellin [uncultured Desulfobacter sp.]|uniref:flagellin N-terminal helical domain-containing protein n=1 Tax=uncultured Desulfobacter sp. TaxID=240139 RepID=UPI002AAB0B02|nr:flagellin [uncultured Desulfobacter sp.]